MNTRLMVLGLLFQEPRHGYGIMRRLDESRVDAWADIRPGSIYQALQQLDDEGLVEVSKSTERGQRVKTEYSITALGRSEFLRLLTGALADPPRSFPSRFYTALGFLDQVPPDEALETLEKLIPTLEATLESWSAGEQVKAAYGLGEPVSALFANGREHIEADLRMMRRLTDHLRSSVTPAAKTR